MNKNRLEERAMISENFKDLNGLISFLQDVQSEFGNVQVGNSLTLRPNIDVELFNNNDNLIVILN